MAKTLYISDFDDTLTLTGAKIRVTDTSGQTRQLSPAEYAVYEKHPGDTFDYSEFDQLIDPRPIPRYVRTLRRAINSEKVDKVVILTARGNSRPVSQFLQSVGIVTGVKIVPLGDSDPVKKQHYIQRQINNGFTRIAFADDSPKNIVAAKELRRRNPHVKLVVHHVDPDAPTASRGGIQTLPARIRQRLQKKLNTRIRNPVTGNNVLVRTILGYGKEHPAYQRAIQSIQKSS
jgi:hypothetical protein